MRIKFIDLYKFQAVKGMTLIELLLASALLSVVILGVGSLDFYYRSQETGEESRLRAQQEVTLVIEHMTRTLSLVMGSFAYAPPGGLDIGLEMQGIPGVHIKARIDRNNNGVIDAADEDPWIGYDFNNVAHTVTYCPEHNRNGWGLGGSTVVISDNITVFELALENNFIFVNISARDNPNAAISFENPEVNMQTRIYMPGYSY